MWDFILYLGQSAVCLAALYLLYKATMSYETLHRLNRVVLLGSVVLAAVLPLCHIKIEKEIEIVPQVAVADNIAMNMVVAEQGVDAVAVARGVVVALFLLGAAVMVARLVISQLSVWRVVRSGEQRPLDGDVMLSVVEKLPTPFSWFSCVVVDKDDEQSNLDLVLEHELAHIRLHHSWDVLAVDVALCVWWFNPALWLLRRELQSLHEYQADEAVLRRGIDVKTYQILLIKRAVGSRLHSVANCLNHSNLKNRITMMCKKNSSRWSAAKLLLVLPLVAVSLAATATTVYVAKQQDKVNENFVNEQAVGEVFGRVIDAKTKKPIPDAILLINGAGIGTNSDASGRYSLKKLPEGKYTFVASCVGYKSVKKDFEVSSKKSAEVNFELEEQAVAVDEIVVDKNKTVAQSLLNVEKALFEKDNTIVLIDGKEGKIEDIDVDDIESFTALKGEQATKIYGEKGKNGVVLFTTKKAAQANKQQPAQEEAFIKVESMPTFQGGDLNGYRNWVQSQLQYPAEAKDKGIMGRVIFSFVVEKDGSVSNFDALQAPDKILVEEVERVFKLTPKWEPGKQNGKAVRVKYTVPIVFALQ